MTLPVLLRPEANSDIQETHDSLEAVWLGLSSQFVSLVRKLLERIEAFPKMFAIAWKDVRAARIKRFRYVLYYVVFDDRVEVLTVIHGSRDFSSWRSRT